MGIITDIQSKKGKNKDRTYVYIDNSFCLSVRTRTWISFNLNIGDEANCEELKEKEKFFWKKQYGKDSWEKEKIRLNYVSKWIKKYISFVDVKTTGFGANSTDFIAEHPKEKGEPDLQIVLENTKTVVLSLEVTGTERKRGNGYWVRPDKIDYIQKHPEKDIWIALHYADDKKIIWIKPFMDKQYTYVEKNLKGAIEYFVVFNDKSPEVHTSQEFKDYIDRVVASKMKK
jgi:hypothetical protein